MNFSEFKSQFNINLNPQQEAAVQAINGPVLLLAVPGSGKTTVLVTRLGYMLYARGIRPERILTMTYTGLPGGLVLLSAPWCRYCCGVTASGKRIADYLGP